MFFTKPLDVWIVSTHLKNKQHKKLDYLLIKRTKKSQAQPYHKNSFELPWTRTENTSICIQINTIFLGLYHHHHLLLPLWIMSIDLFRHQHVAIVS
jgi:hypothetical protein